MANVGVFTAPIPGQSLTAELGARPWQHPPKLVTVDEAAEFYAKRVFNPEIRDDLVNVMETGFPLTTIAEALQAGGVMQGMHTIDVGILVMPIIVEMLAYIGDEEGANYKTGIEPVKRDEDKYKDSAIALATKRIKDRMEKGEFDKAENAKEPMPEEPVEQPPLKGLMARAV